MVNGIRWDVLTPEIAARDWDGFVSSFDDHHIRQTLAWGRLKTGSWTPAHAALFNGPTPLAAALILERRLPLGVGSLFWINGGPLYRKRHARGQDLSALQDFLEGLKERARSRGRAIIRLNFDIAMDLDAQLVVRAAGFSRPLSPLGTGLTYRADLTKPLEDIRGSFEKNWRNQLNRAEKAGAVVEFGRSPELLRRYQPLHDVVRAQGYTGSAFRRPTRAHDGHPRRLGHSSSSSPPPEPTVAAGGLGPRRPRLVRALLRERTRAAA